MGVLSLLRDCQVYRVAVVLLSVTTAACGHSETQRTYSEFVRCMTGKQFSVDSASTPSWSKHLVNLKSERRRLNYVLVGFAEDDAQADAALERLRVAARTVGPALALRPERIGLRVVEWIRAPTREEQDVLSTCL